MFIFPNFLRLHDRVLADSFPLLFTLFDGIAVSKTDPKLKNSVDSIAPEKGSVFSVSTLLLILSVQSNVTCDLRGTTNIRHENCAFYRVRSTRWFCIIFFKFQSIVVPEINKPTPATMYALSADEEKSNMM